MEKTPPNTLEVLDFKGLCNLLKASRPTVRLMEKRGDGPPFVLVGRRRRYPVAGVALWLNEKGAANKVAA